MPPTDPNIPPVPAPGATPPPTAPTAPVAPPVVIPPPIAPAPPAPVATPAPVAVPKTPATPVLTPTSTLPKVSTPTPNPAPSSLPTPTTSDDEGAENPHTIRKILGFLLSWVIIPGLLVLFVHNFVFQAWYVDGQSMEPNFQNGDYLIVAKWDVSLKKLTGQSNHLNLNRGDVVIFNPPGYSSDIYFIKRTIGLPGERVVVRDGTITIYNAQHTDGFVLAEPYVASIHLEGDIDTTVSDGQVFVVGDNRNPGASHDSRAIGPIPETRIIGTADLRLLPVSQFGTLPHPSY